MITIPDNIDSKYRFVILSALRARQIQGGSMPMIKEPRHKATQVAQKEILEGPRQVQNSRPATAINEQEEEQAE